MILKKNKYLIILLIFFNLLTLRAKSNDTPSTIRKASLTRQGQIAMLVRMGYHNHLLNFLNNNDLSSDTQDLGASTLDETLEQQPIIADNTDDHGATALHYSARFGHEELLHTLIDLGATIDSRDNEGWTPLMEAAAFNNKQIIKILLEKGADINAVNKNGYTPLMHAVSTGDPALLESLVNAGAKLDVSINSTDYYQSPLHIACSEKDLPMIHMILTLGESIDRANTEGMTILMQAVLQQDIELVKFILDQKTDVNLTNNLGANAIMLAAQQGNPEIVQVLLDKKADPNYRNQNPAYYHTVLHTAAANGHDEIIKILLKNGAQIDYQGPEGYTALMWAALKGHLSIVKQLLKAGSNPNLTNTDGETPLKLAFFNTTNKPLMKLLTKVTDKSNSLTFTLMAGKPGDVMKHLDMLEDPYKPLDDKGRTPLMYAARRGLIPVIKALIDEEAVSVKDIHGETPFFYAVRGGHTRICQLLLDEDIEIDEKNNKGQTSLMIAVELGDFTMVKKLDDLGAYIDEIDNDGNSILMYCVYGNNEKILSFILNCRINIYTSNKDGLTAYQLAGILDKKDIAITIIKSRARGYAYY